MSDEIIQKSKSGSFSHDEFVRWFFDADSHNRSLFAEQRSNLQLFSGDHYARKVSRALDRILRDRDSVSDVDRIRLTKNHTQRICKRYINNLISMAPSVGVQPKNKEELQDRKSAELNGSVWEDFKEVQKYSRISRDFYQDLVVIGESWAKVLWNPQKTFIGYEDEIQEIEGEKFFTGKKLKVFEGGFEVERLFGFDVLTDPEAISFESCQRIGIRKMLPTKKLKKDFPGKAKFIQSVKEGTFKIWNSIDNTMETNPKGMSLVKELYIRPGPGFPEGYFVIGTDEIILEEGELPVYEGKPAFPIFNMGWDKITKSPRSRSIIKQIRPYQAEINRAASKMAEHQVTLGDDKIYIQDGSKVTQSSLMPGIRVVKVSGPPPQVIPGRAGDQYISYIQQNIAEMYEVAMLPEDEMGKETAAQDPYAMLYRSMKQKKAFVMYVEKVIEFHKDICEHVLMTARAEYEDNRFVAAAGKSEQINIEEFRSQDTAKTRIIVSERSGDLDTDFGKQMAIQHMLQFVGQSLDQKNLGNVIRAMPFLNDEKLFSDLTMDHDNAENLILYLDRGMPPTQPRPFEDDDYMIRRLDHRMRQGSFMVLPQEIQANYQAQIQAYEQMKTQKLQNLEAAKAGFIPMGGGMVAINMSAPDPQTGMNRRIYIPSGAIEWMLKKLQEQGFQQADFFGLPSGPRDRVSQQLTQARAESQAGSLQLNPEEKQLQEGAPPPQVPPGLSL